MDGNDTAYPIAFDTPNGQQVFGGLTKRELFAAMAMQGMLAHYGDAEAFEFVAARSGEYADALLQALATTSPEADK